MTLSYCFEKLYLKFGFNSQIWNQTKKIPGVEIADYTTKKQFIHHRKDVILFWRS